MILGRPFGRPLAPLEQWRTPAARRRISLSIKQAAEGGEVAEEYREHFGDHAFDEEGNYLGAADDAEREAAWAEYYQQYPEGAPPAEEAEAGAEGADA